MSCGRISGGILTSRSSFDAPLASKTHVRHPSEDFLLGPGSLSQLQSGIEKMGLGTNHFSVLFSFFCQKFYVNFD
jgi:hypothetical protein